jgi:hypothetical protein
MAKGESGAAKKAKKELDPELKAQLDSLVSAVKRPKTLDDLLAALQALTTGSEAANLALKKLRDLMPFKTFGGTTPDESEGAVSWDAKRLLVIEADLADAKIVARRGMRDEAAPKSGERPQATNDHGGETPGEPSQEGGEGAAAATADGSAVDPGADPDEVAKTLYEALKARGEKVSKVTGQRLPGGRGRVVVKVEGPPKAFDISRDDWGQSPAEIARGIVAAMGGGE